MDIFTNGCRDYDMQHTCNDGTAACSKTLKLDACRVNLCLQTACVASSAHSASICNQTKITLMLKEQREEAAYRLQAMKQQEDLCDQYGAFDGLTDSDLDDETRAYKAYLEESIANIGRYLGKEIGVGVKNAMVMLEREQEELGDREKEEGGDSLKNKGPKDDTHPRRRAAAAARAHDRRSPSSPRRRTCEGRAREGERRRGKAREGERR